MCHDIKHLNRGPFHLPIWRFLGVRAYLKERQIRWWQWGWCSWYGSIAGFFYQADALQRFWIAWNYHISQNCVSQIAFRSFKTLLDFVSLLFLQRFREFFASQATYPLTSCMCTCRLSSCLQQLQQEVAGRDCNLQPDWIPGHYSKTSKTLTNDFSSASCLEILVFIPINQKYH